MAEPEVRFTIPGPPRGWQRTGQRIATSKKTGKQFIVNYTPGETRSDEWVLKRAAMEAMGDRPPLDDASDLRITAWSPIPRSWSKRKQDAAIENMTLPITKPDFDNISKLVDGIKGVVWRDDCLVTDFHFYKRFSTRPRTVVEVRLATPSRPMRDPLSDADDAVAGGRPRKVRVQQDVAGSPLVGSL